MEFNSGNDNISTNLPQAATYQILPATPQIPPALAGGQCLGNVFVNSYPNSSIVIPNFPQRPYLWGSCRLVDQCDPVQHQAVL